MAERPAVGGPPRHGLVGRGVLVAEDEGILALELQGTLRNWGCTVLGPVASADEALALLRRERPDAALLDLKLRDGWATRVAEALAAAGVPFALVTGYGADELGEPALRGAPHLGKPYRRAELRRLLDDLLVPDSA